MHLLIRWLINAIALVVAAFLVPGITVEGDSAFIAFGITAIVLGLLNATLRPLLTFLTCGFVVLTLGIGLLFINAFVLWAAAWISSDLLGIGFAIDGFWSAFLGGIVVSVVSFLLSLFADGSSKT
ncbi:MAG: phage holin family protein [Actinobacteria bacterium]|nr:phage holin family protein [Actinomycetota bacterium]MCL5887803.1 phage holin family protein [Actinomycetota bacterium]